MLHYAALATLAVATAIPTAQAPKPPQALSWMIPGVAEKKCQRCPASCKCECQEGEPCRCAARNTAKPAPVAKPPQKLVLPTPKVQYYYLPAPTYSYGSFGGIAGCSTGG